MNLLDRNSNTNIIIAGIIALIVGVGVARFVFTSLLPSMLESTITLTFAGVLASLNFAGYLSGSIFAVFIKNMQTKVKWFRIGMVLAILTTLVLAITTNEIIWLISRIIAGFAAAMGLVVGSAIVMSKLKFDDKTKAMGIHFSGIGFSIAICDIVTRIVFFYAGTWQDAWMVLTIFGAIIALYPMYILNFDKTEPSHTTHHKIDKSIFSVFVIVLLAAYFTEGVGFVIQGTFLPDIINSLEGLEGFGTLTWLIVGISGIFSCIIWMRLAARFGYITIIIIAMSIQALGVLIPTFTVNPLFIVLSGVFYGGTFVGLVALFMSLGGKLAGSNPVILMGALTTAYGIGQVIAPLYAVVLTDWSGNYNYALYVTAIIIIGGILLLLGAKKILKVQY
ncbi:MAG: YbfB/YjiJ family MFS transporter [Candidatus Marinarcus sp.]|uniref:YbfB/YjiJ family MFS transporter n=1 Tax=Candidatus Marinarcus sp. TaxID=3100987 RepID=UPI003AFFE13D